MTSQAPLSVTAKATATALSSSEKDQRFVIYGVPWETYVMLRDALDEHHSGLRMTYLEGTLEFMNPSQTHEDYKKIISRLLEAYAEENDLDLRGYGSTTYRKKAKQRGIEPDECYSLGPFSKRPDIAIEVALSSGFVDKLAVYHGLAVPEVWTWKNGKLMVHRWTKDGYEPRARSLVLPDLDLDHLASFVALNENQTRLVKAYRKALTTRT